MSGDITPGAKVMLHSLQSRDDLNGATGVVTKWNDKQSLTLLHSAAHASTEAAALMSARPLLKPVPAKLLPLINPMRLE